MVTALARRANALALVIVVLFTLAITLGPIACHPQPGPDGGTVTPSGVVATIDTIAEVLDVLLPVLRPIVRHAIGSASPDAQRAVDLSLTGFEASASAWQAGRSTWDARGGDRCTAYAVSGALADSTRSLVRDLGRAGVGWGPDLEALLTSLGRLTDRLIGACPTIDGGALASSGRAGNATRAFLESVDAEAHLRGVSLVPLAAVRR